MKNKGVLKRLLIYTKPYAPLIIMASLCAAVNVIMMLSVPVTIGNAIDNIVGPGQVDYGNLKTYIFKLTAAVIVASVMQWLTVYIGNLVTGRIVRDLRVRLFNKITTLPIRTLDGISHGRIVNSATNDVDMVSDGLLTAATRLFSDFALIIGTLVFMSAINIYIAAAVVLLTPLSLITAAIIAKGSYRYFNEQTILQGEFASDADRLLSCRETMAAYNYREHARARIGNINDKLAVTGLRAQFWSAMTNPSTRFVNALVFAAAGILGAVFAVYGYITVGQISTFLIYAGQYTKPFNEISSIIAQLQSASAAAARVFEITDLPDEEETNTLQLPDVVKGNIEFREVDFSYDVKVPLIRGFSLSAKKGNRVAIVGQTGSGKTTIINLLMRFFETDGGVIELDGTNINHVSRRSLRAHFGMVLQDSWLFAGTIRDNISYGKPGASDAEIEKAARDSRAHGFISRLPDGYNTYINDHTSLSYGQTQLLCIARVMLINPPILILDEATSGIDTRTEIRVQDALSVLMRGKTSFVVAHRLSTIMNADIIVVMQDGRIAEQGTHADLMLREGIYARLFRAMAE
ncbi:MAG: ABC transporter ATP-binding protein [Eubacteriales bacterium]|nr:ABC transporter ATP-binding protein [Eubacteriales bacterium]